MSAAPDMKAWAMRYAARGWPVFPLWWPVDDLCACGKADCGKQAGKHPHGRLAPHGFEDATTDADKVAAWWTAAPLANIGIRTGVAFDLFDVDHDDVIEGTAHLPEMEMAGGPVARTGRGWHFLVLPTGLGGRTRFGRHQGESHCDWRGRDGYMVAPPSLHYSGVRYRWYSPDDLAIAPAPPELFAALNEKEITRDERSSSTSPGTRLPSMGTGQGWSASGPIESVRTAVEGTRNDMLNWAAYRLTQDYVTGRCSRADLHNALEQLEQVAVSIGLSATEARATIRSGFKSAAGSVAA
jgi:hypothetical protein